MKKIIILLAIVFSFFMISPMKSNAASTIGAGQVNTYGSNLNVRSKASTSSSIITKLSDGSYVTLISENSNFYYARVNNNTYGYVHKNYIKTVSTRVVETTDNLNIRTSGSLSASIIKTVPKGTNLIILSSSTYWSKVVFDGNRIGYAYNTYLKSTNSINLNVTNYKQYDSRWKYEEIVPGQNMGQIGCLTTSFAITESYRTGSTITPSTMRKRLTYTSNGSAYWPSNYTQSQSSNYLNITLSKLKEGKPVIMGLKKSSGAMHFFVVKGFKGGSVTASNFLVSDPGSSTRTTLNQILESYPYFYKIAYYN